MKPIRTMMLAALTAAITIAPLASAEAHKRYRHGGDVAAAIALGLFTAGVLSHANRHRHHRVYRYGRKCYGLPYHAYHRCMGRHHYGAPVVVYPHPHRGGHYYRFGSGGRHIYKNAR